MSAISARPQAIGRLADRSLGILGLAGVAVILIASIATAIPYMGYAGEPYSPFNHFISELGEVARSRLAVVFDAGVVAGAVLLGSFTFELAQRIGGRYRMVLALAGIVSGSFGMLVGIFPMDTHELHRIVSDGFFLTGWIIAGTFTLWLVRYGGGFPGILIVPGLLAIAIDFVFVAAYTTYHPADPDAPILSRPEVWSVPLLEWASLLSLLLWFVCVALVLVRRRAQA